MLQSDSVEATQSLPDAAAVILTLRSYSLCSLFPMNPLLWEKPNKTLFFL